MGIEDKIDTDIAIRILNIVSSDVREHIAPYLRRCGYKTPIVGDPTQVRDNLYEVPLVYSINGTWYQVERYLLDLDLTIQYPSPENESAKVIAAKLQGIEEVRREP